MSGGVVTLICFHPFSLADSLSNETHQSYWLNSWTAMLIVIFFISHNASGHSFCTVQITLRRKNRHWIKKKQPYLNIFNMMIQAREQDQ